MNLFVSILPFNSLTSALSENKPVCGLGNEELTAPDPVTPGRL